MIQSGYNPQGGNQLTTSTQGLPPLPGMGGGGLPFDPSAAIRQKLAMEAEEKAYERQMRERALKMQENAMRQGRQDQLTAGRMNRNMMTNRETGGIIKDPLAELKARDAYDARLRQSAMRPVGLGPNMISGMAVDTSKLPTRLQPQGSSFQGAPGPSMAGLSREPEPEMAPSSNRGYDYADPMSQAAAQRLAFGKR